jgi:hypothetical protein
MNCKDIDVYLTAATPAGLPPSVLEHLSTCESCRRLYDSLQAPPPFDDALTHNIVVNSAILADLNAVKPLPSDSTLLIVCMACATLVAITGVITWGKAGWQAQGPAMRVLVFSPILLTLVASEAAAEPVMSFSVGGAMESADSVLDSSTKVVDHHQIALEAV